MTSSGESDKPTAVLFIDHSNIELSAKAMDRWVRYDQVLKKLNERYNLVSTYIYLHNGTGAKQAEYLYNIGMKIVSGPSNCDAPMGYDIAEITRAINPSTIIIASHDGDFRPVADRLETVGRQVIFLVFTQSKALSSFIRSQQIIDLASLLAEEQSLN